MLLSRLQQGNRYGLLVSSIFAISWCLPLFWRFTSSPEQSDIMLHALGAKKFVESNFSGSYTIWPYLIYSFSFGSENYSLLRVVSVILLTLLTILLSITLFKYANSYLNSQWLSVLAVFALFSMVPLQIADEWGDFIGYLTQNSWHNSTTIASAPFAVLSFIFGIRYIQKRKLSSALLTTVSLFISILFKPNFALAYLPVFCLYLLLEILKKNAANRKNLLIALIIVVLPSVLLLFAQYFLFVQGGSWGYKSVISPFSVWHSYAPNIPRNVFLSLAGLVAAIFSLKLSSLLSPNILISLGAFLLATLEFVLFAESDRAGNINLAGNWGWGTVTTLLITELVIIVELLQNYKSNQFTKSKLIWALFALIIFTFQILLGFYYFLSVVFK